MSDSNLEFTVLHKNKEVLASLVWSRKNETFDIMTGDFGCSFYSESMQETEDWIEANELKP